MTRFGNVSTYPPTQCGLATFSAALLEALHTAADPVEVVSVVDTPQDDVPDEVTFQWVKGDPAETERAARHLDNVDVALIQHEFGIFGGPDGADVLDLVRALRVPYLVVLHTVLVHPSANQRAIIEELVERACVVVVMTRTAKDRLVANYAADGSKVSVIPHGAPDVRPDGQSHREQALAALSVTPGPGRSVLTWGLIGEGKGIEWGIEALTQLADLTPEVTYYVVGETHPKVVERVGERYRNGLIERAERLGVADRVRFVDRYLANEELDELVRWADVILLPYDSREQVTSGVLVEAVTAERPVVSTDFPHAHELLSSGAGLLVPQGDPDAIAAALRRVFTEPGLVESMTAEAERLAPTLLWPAVADSYRALAANVCPPAVAS